MKPFIALILIALHVAHAKPQTTSSVDPKITLQVSIAGTQREFRIGEIIPIQLSFSSSVKDRYQINMAQYDRLGRMNYEEFEVFPRDGAVDPLPGYKGSLGGLTNYGFLTSKPWSITVNLNEWLRFTRPSEYRLRVLSRRVGIRDPANAAGASPVKASSHEIKIKIIAADQNWERKTFADAVMILDSKQSTQSQDPAGAKRRSIEILRFLGTQEAAMELAKRMRGEDSDGLDYICSLGLIGWPERETAKAALMKELAEPHHPIEGTFLYTLQAVSTESSLSNPDWREGQRRALESLIAALPLKRGKALSVSLSTAVNTSWNLDSLPNQTIDLLAKQLVAMFDQLPLEQQNFLLSERWNKIGGPAMLPLVRKYAERYEDFPEMRAEPAFNSLLLSATALRRWYELDPTSARPAFITEILRPHPRFGAKVLGILPDETLPEVDTALAEHLVASTNPDACEHLSSLIARYATGSILPQITEQLDKDIGKCACGIQNPLLAYVLRVNSSAAEPLIERAVAARGDDFTACNQSLFQIVSEIHNDPVLERIAIQSLDDSDPEVAMTAATMLGRFGSPEAEAALWQRYTGWCQQWSGRESELDRTFADKVDDRTFQLSLGLNLVQALATGKSWLADRTKLERLAAMSSVRQLHQQRFNRYLESWQKQPLTISLNLSQNDFYVTVAQYELHSLPDFKNKLAQFPARTKFILSTAPGEASTNNLMLAEIRTFLQQHEMIVLDGKE